MKDQAQIRVAHPGDLTFLHLMVYEAFYWEKEANRPPFRTVQHHPEFQKLLAGWGRPGDNGVIAEAGSIKIGASWYRLWNDEHHSYGFVDEYTPELGIAVHSDHRSKGYGRMLLRKLMILATKEGFAKVSLSVAPENYALRLYKSEGFVKIGESGTSWTMVCQLP